MTDPAAKPDAQALRGLHRIAQAQWWDALRAAPRALEPRRLTRFGRKAFSQNDDDGILQEIFARIGARSRRFVEFGVEQGVECNTALLLMAGWSGLWMDGSDANIAEVRRNQAAAVAEGRLHARQAFITAENIDPLLHDWLKVAGGDGEIDLLSIDIDRNDYWVWKSLDAVRPRVVTVEYNSTYPPPVDFLVPYEAEATWSRTSYFGASLTMLERLGRSKGYALVGCGLAGVNAFFVRQEELAAADGSPRFHAPYTAAEHYEPPRYGLCAKAAGHKPAFGLNAAADEVAGL